jgi:pyridoxamine 5'-phosphate oxidase
MSVANMRTAYTRGRLDEGTLGDDPLAALAAWIEEAAAAGMLEPNAMALATADGLGRPTLRMVLCKGVDARGVAFYTHLASRKGRELEARPVAAATFWWDRLERQVRVEGPVAQLPADEVDAYFASRPRGSRLGAWASPQSRPVADRAELERAVAEAEARFPDGAEVPRPPGWVGFRLAPSRIEFWQGRESRLHDRIVFTRRRDAWETVRLAP